MIRDFRRSGRRFIKSYTDKVLNNVTFCKNVPVPCQTEWVLRGDELENHCFCFISLSCGRVWTSSLDVSFHIKTNLCASIAMSYLYIFYVDNLPWNISCRLTQHLPPKAPCEEGRKKRRKEWRNKGRKEETKKGRKERRKAERKQRKRGKKKYS